MSIFDITAALAATASPANAEVISLMSKKEPKEDSNRVPHPSHRHAAPSAPWPWVDLEDGMWTISFEGLLLTNNGPDVDREQLENPAPPIPAFCAHDAKCNNCWTGYPQSRFPNWTYKQVVKSKIHKAINSYNNEQPCILHRVDIDSNGFFTNVEPIVAHYGKDNEVWHRLIHEKVKDSFQVGLLSPFSMAFDGF